MDRVEIFTSKKKAILMLIGSMVFVVLGIMMFINADQLTEIRSYYSVVLRGFGILGALFFGLGVYIGVKRLIKKEIAIIIDSKGINVNPKHSESDFIEWNDISGFKEIRIQSQKIIIIGLKNPEYWVEKETNLFRRRLMQFNLKNYDSPFNIATAGLDISYKELTRILNRYYEEKNEVHMLR